MSPVAAEAASAWRAPGFADAEVVAVVDAVLDGGVLLVAFLPLPQAATRSVPTARIASLAFTTRMLPSQA